jgi:hypothetical protein
MSAAGRDDHDANGPPINFLGASVYVGFGAISAFNLLRIVSNSTKIKTGDKITCRVAAAGQVLDASPAR